MLAMALEEVVIAIVTGGLVGALVVFVLKGKT